MSNNTIIIVGKKAKDFKNHIVNEYDEVTMPENTPLTFAGYGYENGGVWRYDLNSKEKFNPKAILPLITPEDEDGEIFGICVAGTWNGAIDLESIQPLIDEAKQIFKERTNQEGKVYVIGEQV